MTWKKDLVAGLVVAFAMGCVEGGPPPELALHTCDTVASTRATVEDAEPMAVSRTRSVYDGDWMLVHSMVDDGDDGTVDADCRWDWTKVAGGAAVGHSSCGQRRTLDADGNLLVQAWDPDGDGEVEAVLVNTWDDDGILTSQRRVDHGAVRRACAWTVTADDEGFRAEGQCEEATTTFGVTHTYDLEGRLIAAETDLDLDGTSDSITVYAYDARGRLSEEWADDGFELRITTYEASGSCPG